MSITNNLGGEVHKHYYLVYDSNCCEAIPTIKAGPFVKFSDASQALHDETLNDIKEYCHYSPEETRELWNQAANGGYTNDLFVGEDSTSILIDGGYTDEFQIVQY